MTDGDSALEAAANGEGKARADAEANRLLEAAKLAALAKVEADVKVADAKVSAAAATAEAESVNAQKTHDVFGVILGTLSRLDTGQGRIEEYLGVQVTRMDTLVDTTNHRLDDFRRDMTDHRTQTATVLLANQKVLADAVAQKVDKKDLEALPLFWNEIKHNRALQGIIFTCGVALSPVVAFNWASLVESVRGIF